MKKKDVTIGSIYSTNVSGRRTNVKVLATVDVGRCGKHRTAFRVQRIDNGRILDKPRDALSLHPAIEEKRKLKSTEMLRPAITINDGLTEGLAP